MIFGCLLLKYKCCRPNRLELYMTMDSVVNSVQETQARSQTKINAGSLPENAGAPFHFPFPPFPSSSPPFPPLL